MMRNEHLTISLEPVVCRLCQRTILLINVNYVVFGHPLLEGLASVTADSLQTIAYRILYFRHIWAKCNAIRSSINFCKVIQSTHITCAAIACAQIRS